MTPPTDRDLRAATRKWQRALVQVEQRRQERDAVIRLALDNGWTHKRISEATGLTRGRIGQIAQRRGKE